jgi:hypothetical protein
MASAGQIGRCQKCADEKSSTGCISCSEGGNITLHEGYAMSPQSQVAAIADETFTDLGTQRNRRTYLAFACKTADACGILDVDRLWVNTTGVQSLNTTAACTPGYVSTLCAVCDDDYFGGANRPCTSCGSDRDSNGWLQIALTLAALFFVGISICCSGTDKFAGVHDMEYFAHEVMEELHHIEELDEIGTETRKWLDLGSNVAEVRGMMRIVVSNYQVISMMPTVLQLDFPQMFKEVTRLLSVLSLDIIRPFHIECEVSVSFFGKYVGAMCMPPVLICIVVAIGKAGGSSASNMIGPISLVLFMLYPSLSSKTFEMVNFCVSGVVLVL